MNDIQRTDRSEGRHEFNDDDEFDEGMKEKEKRRGQQENRTFTQKESKTRFKPLWKQRKKKE